MLANVTSRHHPDDGREGSRRSRLRRRSKRKAGEAAAALLVRAARDRWYHAPCSMPPGRGPAAAGALNRPSRARSKARRGSAGCRRDRPGRAGCNGVEKQVHAVAAVQGQGARREPPSGGAVPRADAGPVTGTEPEGQPARQPDRRGRQPRRVEGAAADLSRQGQVHLHRSALQHGQRGVGLQRPGQLPHDARLAGQGRRPRGPDAARQVVLHDAAPPEAAARAALRRRRNLRVHRRQRGAPAASPHGRGVRGGEFCRDHDLAEDFLSEEHGKALLGGSRLHSRLCTQH